MKNILENKKIVIVEDDINIAKLISRVLKKKQAFTYIFTNGKEALSFVKKSKIDMVLLDIMLPDTTGFEMCSRISSIYSIPIIMITAKSHIDDKIRGLEQGADDYITKPFHIAEVVIRIEKLLKRVHGSKKIHSLMQIADNIVLLEEEHKVKVDNKHIKLNPKEYELLVFLINNSNQVLTREQILDKVWGIDFYGDIRTVDVNVQRLRKKLKLTKEKSLIETVFKIGYKMNISIGD
ncbi:response regulator transcription factor [Clostridiaceae bacterium M8S5]|nr:response regulator transcription factor [Clostridiaceae bacterium M8S5]